MRELSPNGSKLYDLMLAIPPDLARIKQELESGVYTKDDVSMAATKFVDEECFCEEPYGESVIGVFVEPVLVQGLHSTYLYDLIRLLLDYGLDPNAEYDDTNIMEGMKYIENEYVGADTLSLLLEHGDDINLNVEEQRQANLIDYDVAFDAHEQYIRRRFDAMVHCWFVYLGYGARLEDGTPMVDTFEECDPNWDYKLKAFEMSDLKNHRNYTFGLSFVPNHGESWSLHIFDKRTCWEVARL